MKLIALICLLALSSLACPAGERSTPSGDGDLAALRAAVERAPDDPASRRQLAIALHKARQLDEAVPHFERAAELDPSPRSLLDLALAYSSVSRVAEAEAAYLRLLQTNPNQPIVLHNLGNLALKRGATTAAIAWYEKALAAKPDYPLGLLHLGEALSLADRPAEAYRAYERVLALEATTPQDVAIAGDALYRLAALDLSMGAPERAAGFLQELLRVDPQHANAHYAYGQALVRLGRPEEARREFEIHMQILGATQPTAPMGAGE